MSDPNITDPYTAARERERLGDEYREAYRASRLARNGPSDRLKTAAASIRETPEIFGGPDTPETFIAGIERQVDFELNVEIARTQLAEALDGVGGALRNVRKAMQNAEAVGDIEAEMSPEIETAFTAINLNLAALRHFLRDATPARP